MNITVSKRFAILAGIGVPLLFATGLLPALIPAIVFWLYNLIIVGLLAVDLYCSPSVSSLKVQRIDSEKLSHQALNRIAFTVHNPSHFILNVQAIDTINDRHFTVSEEDMSHSIPPGGTVTFSYCVTPSKRGAFTFTHIHLRIHGLLGLGIKHHAHHCPMEYKVYPNLQDLNRFRIMTQKNRLLPKGEKTVRLFGSGTEFESLRTYVEGDDCRKINWPVTAREMRFIVNDYQTEKNQPIFMMIDAGRPMSYNVKGYQKLDYAINAALVLSDIVNQKGDQSGLLVFNKEVHSFIMPGKGDIHRNNLMEALYHIQGTRDTSDYQAAFLTLCQRQKRRSLVFIFTDFETLEEARALTSSMAQLKQRHVPIIVFMKNEGLIALTNHNDRYVQEVAQSFLTERRQLFRTLNAMSVPNIETPAEKFSTAAVNQYLALRKI